MPQPRSVRGRFITVKEKERRERIAKINSERKAKRDSERITFESIGRRIVNIHHIGEKMWCLLCDSTLSFRDIIQEKRNGDSSVFLIRCRTCLAVKPVSTHSETTIDGRELFDSNFKGDIVVDAGIGPNQMNTMLPESNIPAPSASLLKSHEKIIGPVLENITQDSCLEELEESLFEESTKNNDEEMISNESNISHSTPAGKTAASYNMEWQKRGTGRTDDSSTDQQGKQPSITESLNEIRTKLKSSDRTFDQALKEISNSISRLAASQEKLAALLLKMSAASDRGDDQF